MGFDDLGAPLKFLRDERMPDSAISLNAKTFLGGDISQ